MPIQVQADCTNFLGGSAIGNHNSNHNSNSKEGRKNPLYSFLNSFRFPYNSNPPHFVNSNPSQNPTYSIPSQPHKSINEQLSSNLKFMNYFPQKTSSHSNFNHVPSPKLPMVIPQTSHTLLPTHIRGLETPNTPPPTAIRGVAYPHVFPQSFDFWVTSLLISSTRLWSVQPEVNFKPILYETLDPSI